MKKIRLTESQLHNVIKESVRRVLREMDYDGLEPQEMPDELLSQIADEDAEEEEYYKDMVSGEYDPESDFLYDEPPYPYGR